MVRELWRGMARLRFVVGVLLVFGLAGCAATPETVPPTTQETVATPVSQPAVSVAEVAKAPVADPAMLPGGPEGVGCPCCKKTCLPADMKAGMCGKKCASCAKMKKCKTSCKSDAKACNGCDKCATKAKKCATKAKKCATKAKCDHDAMKGECCAKCGKDTQTGKKCELPAMMPGMMDHQNH